MTAQNTGADWERIAQALQKPRRFVSGLQIEDPHGGTQPFTTPFPEQVDLLAALLDPNVRTIVVCKARQLGISTILGAWLLWRILSTPHPLKALIATNHGDTTKSSFRRLFQFYNHLPEEVKRLRPAKFNRSTKNTEVALNGALINHVTMGGTSGGRSWTYQLGISEEFAFWPNADDAMAAMESTFHEGPGSKWIKLSTPNGPGNNFHKTVLAAQKAVREGDPAIRFFFFPWWRHAAYQKPPPDGWTPSDADLALQAQVATYGPLLSPAQLYWRHDRIYGVKGIGEAKFNREYPDTVERGFLVVQGAWYDLDYLNAVLLALGAEKNSGRTVRIFKRPKKGVRYVAGIDPSWCTGGDNAVCQILDQFGEQCAVLSMNQGGERLFAREAMTLCAKYNRAKANIESNKGGAGLNVVRDFEASGMKVARDADGKAWTTHRGNREVVLSYHRSMVNTAACKFNDHQTVSEMMSFREENGKLEGQDGAHDDHVMAHALAVHLLRSLPSSHLRPYAHPLPKNPAAAVADRLRSGRQPTRFRRAS